jgi:hypothetical protein
MYNNLRKAINIIKSNDLNRCRGNAIYYGDVRCPGKVDILVMRHEYFHSIK